MASSALDKYCGSVFWNTSLSWETDNPDLTKCFEKTVLVWIPCIFLWSFASFEIYYITHSKYKNIPWNFLNITKFMITILLVMNSIADLTTSINYAINRTIRVYNVDIYTPIIKFLSLTLSGILLIYNRKNGLRTSGLLFIFWFLSALCGAPQFRTELMERLNGIEEEEEEYYNISYLVYYPLVLVMLVLNCFADKAPKFSQYTRTANPSPEEGGTSFLRRIFYQWFDPLAWKGFRKPLESSDLWDLRHEDMAKEVVPLFEKYWDAAVKKAQKSAQFPRASYKSNSASVDFVGNTKKKEVSVLPALCKAYGPTFLFGAFLKLLQDILTFVNPQILKFMITYTENKEPQWKGYMYVACLFIVACLQTLISGQYNHRMYVVGMRIRTALIAAVYKKALKMSNSAKKESTVGEIVNLMAIDAQQFIELMAYINLIWSAPLQIILCLYFLWEVLGPSVLAGVAVMIILIPINGAITKRAQLLQIQQMQNKDERIKIINEVLNGMKVLKLYAWEPSFREKVMKIRGKEIKILKQAAYFNAGMSFIWSCAPFLVALMTFITFVQSSTENILTPQIAFVSLTLFSTMHFVMGALPLVVVWAVETWVSIKRINKFMNCEELDPDSVQHDSTERAPIVIENGNFNWGEESTLKNINLTFEKNTLTAIVGGVGSGKSSLISALLGEMDKISGKTNTIGSIAYVSQQAWIQNATLQDNILFGKSMDRRLYNRVIEACALKPDLDMLSAGDQTEIGEKGINLSGGQRQRISLARAVYANADIYLLDDPLSAVDSHVGKHIFEKVIGPNGILRNTTRLFVTHAVTYLPEVDQIIVLKDGEISEIGSYQQLLDKKGAFSEFLTQYLNEITEKDGAEDLSELKDQLTGAGLPEDLTNKLAKRLSQISETSSEKQNGSLKRKKSIEEAEKEAKADKLIEEEEAETGNVKWSVYKYYFKSLGVFLSGATIVFMILFQGFNVASNLWLNVWSVDGNVTESKRDMYLGVYGALGFGQAVTIFLAALALFMGALNGAHRLHNLLLDNIMKAPCNTFFDVTPIGRILNRFSRDIDTLDSGLAMVIRGWLNCFFAVVSTLFIISYSTPIFISVIIPIGILYYFIQRFYIVTSRQLKRLESISRSPIYSHFSETVTGAPAIRAYGETERFIRESEAKVDYNQHCYYPSIIANRWLSIRLEMVGNIVLFFAALFAVLAKDQSPGLVGLSITYALLITQSLNWLVVMTSDVETSIVSVERIKEYGDIASEAPWDIPNRKLPVSWPENGTVVFKDFALRYRPGLDLVLKGINFNVRGGEKVGIVGRTGAGKSSLTTSLFRIVEASQGEILIDGINIAELGLHTLRSRITIIPQDSTLFSGSLRMNLDPYEKYNDDEIWQSLDHAHLKEYVQGLPAGLNHEVTEGGENLSVGQRQLVCLSRALLRKTKVLVMDEATAAVDLETDDLIQQTIRREFNECTILTIAHRLNTIMDSDRVIVLDKGYIVEFDTPENLLKNSKSVFYGMAKDAGLV